MNITYGMVHGGAVRHVFKAVNAFGMLISACGRVIIAGDSDSRLCKTCARIHKIAEVITRNETECTTDHTHINSDEWISRKYTGFERSMFRDVVEDYHNGAENDLCWIRTLEMILNGNNLAQEVRTPELGKRQGGNNNGGMIDPKNAKPARKRGCGTSPKQEELIKRILGEIREMNSETADLLETIYTEEWHNTVEWKRISPAIDALFAAKNVEQRKARETQAKEIKSSREWRRNQVYVIDGVFHRVHISQSSGNPYTQSWNEGEWIYQGQKFLKLCTDATACTAAQAKAWAHEHDSCVFCHKPLDDQRSREAGYGSTCADKNGLPWGE